jgi:hypothetical protein
MEINEIDIPFARQPMRVLNATTVVPSAVAQVQAHR